MAERAPTFYDGSEQEESSAESTDSEEERRFISKIIESLRPNEGEAEVQPEKDKHATAWEKLFEKLFGRTVSRPEAVTSELTKSVASTGSDPSKFNNESMPLDSETLESDDGITGTQGIENTDQESHSHEDILQIDHESDIAEGLDSGTTKPTETPSNNVAGANNQLKQEDSFRNGGDSGGGNTIQASSGFSRESVGVSTKSNLNAIDRDTVIKTDRRGLGVLTGLLGAEFFARRRGDRKIDEKIKKINDSIRRQQYQEKLYSTSSNKPIDNHEVVIHKNSKKAQEQKVRHIVQNHSENHGSITSPNSWFSRSETQSTSTQANSSLESTMQRIVPREANATDRANSVLYSGEPEFKKQSRMTEKLSSMPENVNLPPDNSELKVARERNNELRHENKGINQGNGAGSGASSVGAILTGSGAGNFYSQAMKTNTNQQTTDSNTTNLTAASQSMYRRAVLSGFWTALVIVVILIIVGIFSN